MKRSLNRIFFLFIVLFGSISATAQTSVAIYPDKKQQIVEGWGSSLCWWAHMVGQWKNEKAIDDMVDMITSPNQLNMNIFRYNIGGGDDPTHYTTATTQGHMVGGKGLRAEMQGFKSSATAPYDWSSDAGQRKIMLKIKAKRPDAVFEGFSNSPPYWMTYSGCSAGNTSSGSDNLKPEFYGQFCDYLVDVSKFYKDSFQLEFKTLEPFNESMTNFWGALGSQEGCHFNLSSQISLIKTLSPKLKNAQLKTVISASDETNLSLFISELNGYMADGTVMDMLGQLNVHTYSGSDSERKTVANMTRLLNKPFWMSETGPMGFSSTPLINNLQLAQKLFADMKIMKPSAWIDWQLMEEANDVWCVFRGSFANETYYKVKNFYVRMQVSRFIKQGYTIIQSDNSDVLAAVNPQNTELVLVTVNNSDSPRSFGFDLSKFLTTAQTAELYRTSSNENCQKMSSLSVTNKRMNYSAPARSISTIVVKAMNNNYEELAIVNGIGFEKDEATDVLLKKKIANNPIKVGLNNSDSVLVLIDSVELQLGDTLLVSEKTSYLHVMSCSPLGNEDIPTSYSNGKVVVGSSNVWTDQVIKLDQGTNISSLKFFKGSDTTELYLDNLLINGNQEARKVSMKSPVFVFETMSGTPLFEYSSKSNRTLSPKVADNDHSTLLNQSAWILDASISPVSNSVIPEDTLIISMGSPLQLTDSTRYLHVMCNATTTQMKVIVNTMTATKTWTKEMWVDNVVDLNSLKGQIIYQIKLLPFGSQRYTTLFYLDSIYFNNKAKATVYQPDNATYRIYSRNSDNALMATSSNTVTQNTPDSFSDAQLWELERTGDEYLIRNKESQKYMTDNGSYFMIMADRTTSITGQNFSVVPVEENYVRITSTKSSKSIDVESASTASGAKIGLWAFGTSGNLHRQWSLVKTMDGYAMNLKENQLDASKKAPYVLSDKGQLSIMQLPSESTISIYSIDGRLVQKVGGTQKEVHVSLPKGTYLITVHSTVGVAQLKGII